MKTNWKKNLKNATKSFINKRFYVIMSFENNEYLVTYGWKNGFSSGKEKTDDPFRANYVFWHNVAIYSNMANKINYHNL